MRLLLEFIIVPAPVWFMLWVTYENFGVSGALKFLGIGAVILAWWISVIAVTCDGEDQ